MTLKVAFRAAARREFIEAVAWYEAQSPGLGLELLREVERCIASVAEHPELYAVVRADIRRVVARRFPYAVYYRQRDDRIIVLAVFHGRRHPRIWQARR
jgi:plasmid stabilization system protein ParE